MPKIGDRVSFQRPGDPQIGGDDYYWPPGVDMRGWVDGTYIGTCRVREDDGQEWDVRLSEVRPVPSRAKRVLDEVLMWASIPGYLVFGIAILIGLALPGLILWALTGFAWGPGDDESTLMVLNIVGWGIVLAVYGLVVLVGLVRR